MSSHPASHISHGIDGFFSERSIDLVEDERISHDQNVQHGNNDFSSELRSHETADGTSSERRLLDQHSDVPTPAQFSLWSDSSRPLQARFGIDEAGPESRIDRAMQHIFKVWCLEMISTTLSICSLIAVAGVLSAYKDRPLSAWKFRYLPNSVISQLMTVARSTMMLSTASCISQSCWLYMQHRSRKVLDIHTLDGASRGPAGSLLLLSSRGPKSFIAILGASITITTLLMEPFTQQVLQYPLRSEVGPLNGSFPVTQFYVPVPLAVDPSPDASDNEANVNSSIQAAIVDSFFGVSLPDMYTCPTNSCFWQAMVPSLGLCSSCINVTSTTKSTCATTNFHGAQQCNYTTPRGLRVQTIYGGGSANMGIQTRISTDAIFEGNQSLITFATLTMTEALRSQRHPVTEITECRLDWCAKVYQNSGVKDRTFLTSVDNYPLVHIGHWKNNSFLGPLPPTFTVLQADSRFPAGLNSTFTTQERNVRSLAEFLVLALRSGNLTGTSGGAGVMDAPSFSFGAAMLDQPSIPFIAERLATSLSNAIRNLTDKHTEHVQGQSLVVVQYIRVRWIWLVLPSVIILLGFLLLVITIWESRRAGAMMWKCSPLALLFHPLRGWSDAELDCADAGDMKKAAKTMQAQLTNDEDSNLRIIRV